MECREVENTSVAHPTSSSEDSRGSLSCLPPLQADNDLPVPKTGASAAPEEIPAEMDQEVQQAQEVPDHQTKTLEEEEGPPAITRGDVSATTQTQEIVTDPRVGDQEEAIDLAATTPMEVTGQPATTPGGSEDPAATPREETDLPAGTPGEVTDLPAGTPEAEEATTRATEEADLAAGTPMETTGQADVSRTQTTLGEIAEEVGETAQEAGEAEETALAQEATIWDAWSDQGQWQDPTAPQTETRTDQ